MHVCVCVCVCVIESIFQPIDTLIDIDTYTVSQVNVLTKYKNLHILLFIILEKITKKKY